MQVSLAIVAEGGDWDWAAAEREYRRAIALNSSLATAYVAYGHLLMVLKRPDAALSEMRSAQALDPVSQAIGELMGDSLYFSRKYDEAITMAKQSLELHPDAEWEHSCGQLYPKRYGFTRDRRVSSWGDP